MLARVFTYNDTGNYDADLHKPGYVGNMIRIPGTIRFFYLRCLICLHFQHTELTSNQIQMACLQHTLHVLVFMYDVEYYHHVVCKLTFS